MGSYSGLYFAVNFVFCNREKKAHLLCTWGPAFSIEKAGPCILVLQG